MDSCVFNVEEEVIVIRNGWTPKKEKKKMFTEQLPDLLDYVNSLPGFACLVGDMNINFDNPLQSLTKQTLSTLCLYNLVQVINKPTHWCGHIIDWVIVRPDDDIHRKSTVTDSL